MLADSLYLENINEYVQDEEKIVTYKWLSRKLDVPVNAAKQMLYSYVSHHRGDKADGGPPVSVTYIVSGLVGNKEHQVHLVAEDELEATKHQLGQILGVHVYSVQKNEVKETESLYNANHDVCKEHLLEYSKWSPIECPNPPLVMKAVSGPNRAGDGSEDSLPDGKTAVQHSESAQYSKATTVAQSETESKPLKTEAKSDVKHTQAEKGSKRRRKEKATVSSMFAKQTQHKVKHSNKVKQEPPVSPKKVKDDPPQHLSPEKITKTTIVHIASPKKSPSKSSRKVARSPTKTTKLTTPESNTRAFKGLGDSDIEDDDSEEESQGGSVRVVHEKEPQKRSKKSKTAQPVKSARKSPLKDEPKKRKRKRVQDLSSDEEDSIAPVVKKPSKEEDTSSKGAGSNKRRRKRVKKRVSKMYVNDEGEMVTERVYESASTDVSDEEEVTSGGGGCVDEPPQSGEAKEEEKPKEIVKAGTKQSSLMRFFKK